jgi:flagellar hook assembly protein FlgD
LEALSPSFIPDSGGVGLVDAVGTGLTLQWDGRNSNGQLAASGVYTMVLTLTDPFGTSSTYSAALQSIRVTNSVEIRIFNSAGELVRHFDSLTATAGASRLDLSTSGFIPGGTPLKIQYSATDWQGWDGRNDRGEPVAPGSYLIHAISSKEGQQTVMTREVVVLTAPGADPFEDAVAGPSPLLPSDKVLRIVLPKMPLGVPVTARVYALSGELVATLNERAADGSLSLDAEGRRLAAGVLVIELVGTDSDGRMVRKTLKAAILR